MIATCRSCHQPFWRYRRDYPPAGYCSLPCHEIGPTSITTITAAAPELPQSALRAIYQHRMLEHCTTSILVWFDCEECDRLELRYSNSLEFHYAAITKEIGSSRPCPDVQTTIGSGPEAAPKTTRPRARKRGPGRKTAENRLQAAS